MKWLATGVLMGLVAAAMIGGSIQAQSGDWPQWGGPQRTSSFRRKGLARTWPASGPRTLWNETWVEGYSAAAVAKGTLFTMSSAANQEVVVAIGVALTGTPRRSMRTTPITVNMSRAPGPRATPLVLGDALFTVGATGRLHTLNARTGAVLWTHDLTRNSKDTSRTSSTRRAHSPSETPSSFPLARRVPR